MKIGNGPAAVTPSFSFRERNCFNLCESLSKDGKAVKSEGKSEDLPEDNIRHRGLWQNIADLEDKKG